TMLDSRNESLTRFVQQSRVENERHAEMLQTVGCDQYQGYFYGRPMAAQETSKISWNYTKTA
ncbi:EAL domain-containing protein, partial [Phaeobacter sp. CECT 5382]|uniref:EAL domain-containing protein n=1 Tax=Phaeobacter sp. CECT 5382 TaxID=1712645 RepID=UPI00071C24B6